MSKKLTHKEFLQKCESLGILNNVEILEEYKGNKEKIKCRCKIHNYIWKINPDSLYRSKKMPFMFKRKCY